MIKEFYEKFINMVIIVSLLLALCVAVDYASTNISNNDTDIMIPDNVTFINGSYVDLSNDSGIAKTDGKIYTDKKVKVKKQKKSVPTVTITSKPSCGCGYGYYWHTMTFKSYCPHCHKTGTLANVHKWPARYEQELTCDTRLGGCGADYCGCCGKEKYSGSHYYLTRV